MVSVIKASNNIIQTMIIKFNIDNIRNLSVTF